MYDLLTESDMDRYREMKEHGVARMDETGTDDVPPLIELWRDGDPLLTIFCPDVDRDMALAAIHFAIPRINADRSVSVMDAHVTNEMVNPTTGKPWAPGEMQHACDQEGACDIGTLTDCLAITDYRRDGTHAMTTLPYHVDKDAKKVHWATDSPHHHEFNDGEISGYVPDVIQQAFRANPETIHALPPELPDDELIVRALKDAYTIIELTRGGYGVAFMATEKNKALFEHIKGILDAFQSMTGGLDMVSSEDTDG